MLFIKTDYVGGVDLTGGKYYLVIEDPDTNTNTYKIADDSGYPISVVVGQPSAHLGDTGIFELYEITKIG